MEGFRGLKVYQKSYLASIEIYKLVLKYPREELYGLTSQTKRAATSIPLNIAEGYAKKQYSQAEYKRFLMMAQGSCNEISVLLDMGKDLRFINAKEQEVYKGVYEEVARMLQGVIRTL